MTRKDIEAEFIALAHLKAQRQPSILVRFVAARDGKAAYPERKCTCKASPGLAFCYCFSDSNEDSDERPDTYAVRTPNGFTA